MAGIIDFPQVVHEALREFGDLLPNEPQRRHFAEYLTGLFVAERKTVSGINRKFAQTTDAGTPIHGVGAGLLRHRAPRIPRGKALFSLAPHQCTGEA